MCFARNLGTYWAQLLAKLVECGVEVVCVPYTTQALPLRRFFLTTIFAHRGGAERGNCAHSARRCSPYR